MKWRISITMIAALFSFSATQCFAKEAVQVWRVPNVMSAMLSDDGSRVAAQTSTAGGVGGWGTHELRIYDATRARELGAILLAPKNEENENDSDVVDAQAFSPDGHHLLLQRYSKESRTFESWNIEDAPRLEWKKSNEEVLAARWIANQITVLTRRDVQRWNEQGKMLSRVPLKLFAYDPWIKAGALSEDGKLAILGVEKCVVFNTSNGQPQRELQHPGGAKMFRFSADAQYVLSGGQVLDMADNGEPIGFSSNFAVWRLSDGQQLWKDTTDWASEVFSRDSRALWHFDKKQFWNIESQQFIGDDGLAPFLAGSQWIYLADISRDNHTFALVVIYSEVRIVTR